MSMTANTNTCNGKRSSISSYVNCALCVSIAIVQHAHSVSGFAPIQERKACEGPLCPRPSRRFTSTSSLPLRKTSPFQNSSRSSSDEGDSVHGDSFAMRMASQQNEYENEHENRLLGHDQEDETELRNQLHSNEEMAVMARRKFLSGLAQVSVAGAMMSTNVNTPQPANAYDKAYPVNLDFTNNDSSINLQSIREQRISVEKAKVQKSKSDLLSQPLAFKDKKDVLGSVAWGGALWLLSGSRSNPLVKPIANALYDTNTRKGAWVKDRNDGLFAPFPAAFSILMGIVFLFLGVVTDRILLFATEGDSNVILQLAGVSLIGGGSLELGRIASGEKMRTREELERDNNLAREFQEFTEKKLIYGQGGSVHRSEVIKSFRRYYGKYRVDNEQYPLNDLEIEQLLRGWNRQTGNRETMSASGFLKNVKINADAEIKM